MPFLRRASGGAIALRAAYLPVAFTARLVDTRPDALACLQVTSALGEHSITILGHADELEHLRVQTAFTPAAQMQL